jgi:hypothetical protein
MRVTNSHVLPVPAEAWTLAWRSGAVACNGLFMRAQHISRRTRCVIGARSRTLCQTKILRLYEYAEVRVGHREAILCAAVHAVAGDADQTTEY